MSDPRAVLAAIEASQPAWAQRGERPNLPVSESAMARPEPPLRVKGPLEPQEIALVRETGGLTQAELARILGVDEGRVSQLERGRRPANKLEADVLSMMLMALAPIPNAADAAACGQRWAPIAAERGPLSAIMQILADGAMWRGADR